MRLELLFNSGQPAQRFWDGRECHSALGRIENLLGINPQQRAGWAINCFTEDCNLVSKMLQEQIRISLLKHPTHFLATIKHKAERASTMSNHVQFANDANLTRIWSLSAEQPGVLNDLDV